MDQYYTSVRELEQRLHSSEEWEYKPKPTVTLSSLLMPPAVPRMPKDMSAAQANTHPVSERADP